MFNRKKRHWQQNKPHYKKGPNEGGQPESDESIPGQERTSVQKAQEPAKQTLPEAIQPQPPVKAQGTPAAVAPAPDPDGQGPNTIFNPANCRFCNMPIRNHYTAIHHNETGELVHFDCVLRELSKEHSTKLGKFRKIYYIGAGNFALVKEFYDKRGHFKHYEIIEKIAYEKREK